MKIPKYDEITYAKLILENGFQTQYYKYELKLITKYWKSIDIKPKQRKEMLYEFCHKNLSGFSKEKHYKIINSIIAYSNKKTSVPIVVKEVPLYQHEFDFLSNLPIQDYQKKVLLSLLVERRIKKYINNLINNTDDFSNELTPYLNMNTKMDKKILTVSKIPTKHKPIDVYYDLTQLGYIQPIERELVKLNFIEELNKQQSEVLATINSFDSVGHYFDMLSGDKKIGFCDTCEDIIKFTSNRKTKCNDCYQTYRRKYKTENKRKERQSVDS